MKIRKVVDRIYITFTTGIYTGKSFRKVENNKFINYLEGTIEEISKYGMTTESRGFDLMMNGINNYTDNIKSYVEQKLQQKLSIHMGELNYPFEDTEQLGIPYLTKKSKEELDLISKDAILNTEGVKNILTYTSEQIGSAYKFSFVVVTKEGIEVEGGNR